MPLSFPSSVLPTPQVLSSMTDDMVSAVTISATSSTSQAWPLANQAYFIPVNIDRSTTYVRAWWLNGTVVAGNIDVGLYTISGTTATRVGGTGATAQAGVSQMQTAVVSIAVTPGFYYLAMGSTVAGATSHTYRPTTVTPTLKMAGVYQLVTPANPIPSSATVQTVAAATACPIFGLSELTTI